jgi:hypothetical protein
MKTSSLPASRQIGSPHARCFLHHDRLRNLRRLRRICLWLEGRLMLANIVWGVGALIIGGYMVVALLRPEKF